MTRRNRVLDILEEMCAERLPVVGGALQLAPLCMTTVAIAARAQVLRTNCSAELNALVRDGKVLKVAGRPTNYLPKSWFERHVAHGCSLPQTQYKSLNNLYEAYGLSRSLPHPAFAAAQAPLYGSPSVEDMLDRLAGSRHSLKEAIDQARIALSYPPSGMHIMLLGETGVGKSTFARALHAHAVEKGYMRRGAPFVSFNCSEYANNPEILLDHLFGHVKGAFTGAQRDKPGLVEGAHSGVLFLDEVHRLPPEGQEMLFHLLDFGEFRRLGESDTYRQTSIRLFAATTEPPESSLLGTFTRRIPMVLRLPSLREWSLNDRYELIYQMLLDEARVIQRQFHLVAGALERLLFAHFPANIGDLKNAVKLSCARALHAAAPGDEIWILREHVQVYVQERTSQLWSSDALGVQDMIVHPSDDRVIIPVELADDSLYAQLDRLSQTLANMGFEGEEIIDAIERELRRRELATPVNSTQNELERLVGQPFYRWISAAWSTLGHLLSPDIAANAFIRVAMHLYGVTRDGWNSGGVTSTAVLVNVAKQYPDQCALADALLRAFERESGLRLPAHESSLVALLLYSDTDARTGRVGAVVALRGNNIASELVATAYQLSAPARVIAVDLPFRQSRSVTDETVLRAIEAVDHGRGVLVLTDAGELLQLLQRQPSRLKDRKLQFVMRPDLTKVVAAMRLLATSAGTVDELAAMLGTERSSGFASESDTRVVWTCCLTGRGTAQSLKRLIESCTPDDMRAGMEITPVELLPSRSEQLPNHERVVAAVGSIDPRIEGIPFFSVEEILTERGMERLLNVVSQGRLSGWRRADAGRAPPDAPSEGSVHDYIRTMLERDLVFANPKLVIECAKAMIDRLRQRIVLPNESTWEARFWLHMGYVIERCVKGEPVVHPYAERIRTTFAQEWDALTSAWIPVSETFRLEADAGELAYLFEMIFTGRSFEEFSP